MYPVGFPERFPKLELRSSSEPLFRSPQSDAVTDGFHISETSRFFHEKAPGYEAAFLKITSKTIPNVNGRFEPDKLWQLIVPGIVVSLSSNQQSHRKPGLFPFSLIHHKRPMNLPQISEDIDQAIMDSISSHPLLTSLPRKGR
jgi:hypothetical protein